MDDPSSPENIARLFYQSVCSPDELNNILEPDNADDVLSRMQADAILDHTRLYRVMRSRAITRNTNTLLFKMYEDDYLEYLSYASEEMQLVCEDVPIRYILTNNYDAACIKTDFGGAIVISEVLRYFLYFSGIFSINPQIYSVPDDVRGAAMLIAVRSMLLSEALDFDLDPRGNVPPTLHVEVEEMVKFQMQFIIGHEYAHYYLGHIFEDRGIAVLKEKSCRTTRQWHVYTKGQQFELDADIHSIEAVSNDASFQKMIFLGGIYFFLNLMLFEIVSEHIEPDFSFIDSHPPTVNRIWNLADHFSEKGWMSEEDVERHIQFFLSTANDLVEHYAEHKDAFLNYGSVYLAEWQGPMLRDRIDY